MRKFSILFTCVFTAALITFSSCTKQDDPVPDETVDNSGGGGDGGNGGGDESPNISDDAKTNGQGVKTGEDPKSDKVKGEQIVNGEINVESPSSSNLSPEALSKLHLLTGNNSNEKAKVAEEALFGWFIDEINGVDVVGTEAGDTYVYFFYNDGSYIEYNLETFDWNWGFYYVDPEVTKIVFDVADDDQQIWTVNLINDETLDITSEGGDRVVLNAYYLGGFDEDEYSSDDLSSKIAGTEMYINYYEFDDIDYNEDDAFYDIQFDGYGTDTIPVIQFNADGSLSVFDREMVYDEFQIQSKSDIADSELSGTWEIDSEGYLVMIFDNDLTNEYVFYISWLSSNELEIIGYSDTYNSIYWWMMDESTYVDDIFWLESF